MRALIWIVVLFAAAVAVALGSQQFNGEIFLLTGNTLRHMNLNAFILCIVVLVVAVWVVIKLLVGIVNIPEGLRRFNIHRKHKQGKNALNEAGQAYFEGRFQKAQQKADAILKNKHAVDSRYLALMVAAHSADQIEDVQARDRYLEEIAKLPEKMQLSRYLLEAQSALSQYEYEKAHQALSSAKSINGNLASLVKLELRYSLDTKDSLQTLNLTGKLLKSGSINDNEAQSYRLYAYRQLLGECQDLRALKACLKRIPEEEKTNILVVEIAQKYQQLGLYPQAVAWVRRYYPLGRNPLLLQTLSQCMMFLSDAEQGKVLVQAEKWLEEEPNDAKLLLCLGQLTYTKKLWGKAQSYLEASLSLQASVQAHIMLAKIFDDTDKAALAKEERKKALDLAADFDEQDVYHTDH